MRISHKRLTIWKTTFAVLLPIYGHKCWEKSSKIGRPDWTTSEPAVAVLCQKSYLKYRLTNTFAKDFCVRITNAFKKDFLCLDNEHIVGGDQGYTPEIMDEILITARDLELEVNEGDIYRRAQMGHEDELTTEDSKKF
ncbi:zinc finger protein [Trichonephila clavipes]|nr:zinc finger protein [Trichonephila clavipes]